jgi:hypothetical protein
MSFIVLNYRYPLCIYVYYYEADQQITISTGGNIMFEFINIYTQTT